MNGVHPCLKFVIRNIKDSAEGRNAKTKINIKRDSEIIIDILDALQYQVSNPGRIIPILAGNIRQ